MARLLPERFLFEPAEHSGHIVRHELEGDKAIEFDILSLVDDPHPATTELLDDAVVRDGLVNQLEIPTLESNHPMHAASCSQRMTTLTWSRRTRNSYCVMGYPRIVSLSANSKTERTSQKATRSPATRNGRPLLRPSGTPPLVSRKAPNTVRPWPSIPHACRPRRAVPHRAPQSGQPCGPSRIDAKRES